MIGIKRTVLGVAIAGALIVPGPMALAKDDYHFHVPRGHMPPPGRCRIWFPGRPPGHQPAPGDCRTLSRQVPRGAWLVGHGRRWSHWELRDRHFRHDHFHGYRYLGRKELYREVRQARQDVHERRHDLERAREELRKERAELRRDIRGGASKQEIHQGRREIREDRAKVAQAQRDLRQSEERLRAAEKDLRRETHRR